MATSKKTSDNFNFETSVEELNKIVSTMEQGDLPLEKSLEYFEQGVGLINQCQKALDTAQQKVDILTQSQSNDTLEPFNSDE